eukprot:81312-Rhodomonas_salina.1
MILLGADTTRGCSFRSTTRRCTLSNAPYRLLQFPEYDPTANAPNGNTYSCACYQQCSYSESGGQNKLSSIGHAQLRLLPAVPLLRRGVDMCYGPRISPMKCVLVVVYMYAPMVSSYGAHSTIIP